MRAFIIRPFGTKDGIDFDRVEADLIAPALDALAIDGRTTGAVIEAGNIREDMFQSLLVADVVVADISVDNPNACYELGIRHALREKCTILLRAQGRTTDVPFDLRTDRYLTYDPANPGAARERLVAALRAALASERQDSPVFRLLPDLREQGRSAFLVLPRGFREEVEYATRSQQLARLALLADECAGAAWESEGLRLVGGEQFRATAYEAAAVTLESLRRLAPLDYDANLMLGTIYQRLGDPGESEQALRRVIGGADAPKAVRAEAFSLLGRNLKAQWRESWQAGPAPEHRARALRSPLLTRAYEAYLKGFREDLNHFYSGLNALAMLTILVELARALPDVWQGGFTSASEAREALAQHDGQRHVLSGAVEFSIQSSRRAAGTRADTAPWVELSLAELRLLAANGPDPAASAYASALEGQPQFLHDSVRSQLQLYDELGLFSEKAARVLDALGPPAAPPPPVGRTILFTGHRIDAPDRGTPRFPPAMEPAARAAIRDVLARELTRGPVIGVAGAASGGDILFHELCGELGIPTRLLLAVPPDAYVRESVAPAGEQWVRRFEAILEQHPSPLVLAPGTELPGWLRHRPSYTIWRRNGLWTLYEALASGGRHLTVLALWNRRGGDGPGGTAEMIRIAQSRGADTHVLDTNVVFADSVRR